MRRSTVLLATSCAFIIGATPPASAAPFSVTASAETKPSKSGGDTDDACIWIHPSDPAKSLVIAADKKLNAVYSYTLDGTQVQQLPAGKMNNIDLRYNFPLGGKKVALVTAGNRTTNSIGIFAVDASGSMGTKLMVETKGAIFSLLLDAYQKRDKVGFVAFREAQAEILLPPTDSIELAKKLLEDLPTGGKTPLAEGMLTSYEVIVQQLRKDPSLVPLLILVSHPWTDPSPGLHTAIAPQGWLHRHLDT